MTTVNIKQQAFVNAANLDRAQQLMGRSLNRLSSGSRLVTPADDPAGHSLSEKLVSQDKRVQAAMTNVQNAVSRLQSTDGFMSGMGRILARMSELATMAKNIMQNGGDIALYQEEFGVLQDQLRNTIGGSTAEIGGPFDITEPMGIYDGNTLFGAYPIGTIMSVGHSPTQTLTIPEFNLRNGAMAEVFRQDASGTFLLTVTSPDAVDKISAALDDLANERASVGAVSSRLELIHGTLRVESQNLTSAISRIKDVDVAKESTRLAKYDILTQSGSAILTQANQSPRSVLRLLEET